MVGVGNRSIPASPTRRLGLHDPEVTGRACWYAIRIRGRLGPVALSAFPRMVAEVSDGDTVLTGWLEDQSAVFGAIAQIEALGLELLELRQVRPPPPAS